MSASAPEDAILIPHFEREIGMSFTQATTILRAHWKKSALIALLVILLAAVVTKAMPKTYNAVATLIVSYDASDPLGGKEFPLGMLGAYMATQTELIMNPEVLEPVIDRLHLASDPDYADGNRGGPATLHSWVESKVRKNLDIEMGKAGSQLIYITASGPSAKSAADLANAVADIYTQQAYERLNGPAAERATRYTEELADLKKKVNAAQDAVTQFRQRTGAIDLDARADIDMDVLNALEHRLLEATANLKLNQARAHGNQAVSANVLASDLVRNLQAQEANLKAEIAKLSTVLGPNHPRIVELKSQIAATQRSLAATVRTYSGSADNEVATSQSEVQSLQKAVQAQREKVLRAHQFRDEGTKYQLELESAQAVYKRALDGYDQIMFASTGHYSNVAIASRARPPVKPDKPNPIKNMLFGAVLGIGMGVAIPFLLELLNRRVRCRDDVERDFGIPVLTEFTPVPRLGAPA